uniref:Corepressor interacting with RBPJ n=1 Tax=Daphnia magna TaxID=35525 RepID=A0A0P5E5S4_9CRUS
MGKGFNNYMCKKFFHPGSRDNLKRVWMAQQKTDAEKKKQEELKAQYEKEQDLYVNKSLVSKESKEKLSVNFLYEPPPGMKKEREREDGEPEFKFEWQRKYNAPREDYCRDNEDIRDQPFGIAVRNVRCIKCHKWGHVNTDRECPLFNKARDAFDEAVAGPDPSEKLMSDMKETGLAMTKSAISTLEQMSIPMQGLLNKSEEEPIAEELTFLKTLSTKEKKKLLKKLEKLEDKQKGKKKKKEKNKRESSSPPQLKSSSSSKEDSKRSSRIYDDDNVSRREEPSHSRYRRSRSRERGERTRAHERDNTSRARERDGTSRAHERDSTNRAYEKDSTNRAYERDSTNRAFERDSTNRAYEKDSTNRRPEPSRSHDRRSRSRERGERKRRRGESTDRKSEKKHRE